MTDAYQSNLIVIPPPYATTCPISLQLVNALVKTMRNPKDTFNTTMPEHSPRAKVYDDIVRLAVVGWRFSATRERYIGIVPSGAMVRKLVGIFKGANLPFVLCSAGIFLCCLVNAIVTVSWTGSHVKGIVGDSRDFISFGS